MVSGLVSPAPAESSPPSENGGTSDLDFGNPKLRRSSPQVSVLCVYMFTCSIPSQLKWFSNSVYITDSIAPV